MKDKYLTMSKGNQNKVDKSRNLDAVSKGSKILYDEDQALWHSITASITPLRKRNIAPVSNYSINSLKRPKDQTNLTTLKTLDTASLVNQSKSLNLQKPSLNPIIIGQIDGLDRRNAERLKRGKFKIEARFDLHGYTLNNGDIALRNFIVMAYNRNLRCVLIITGKGKGILQKAIPRWLNHAEIRSKLISVQHAQPKDGGGGALYVLLKRRR